MTSKRERIEERRDRIFDLLVTGQYSMKEIAAKVGCSRSTFYRDIEALKPRVKLYFAIPALRAQAEGKALYGDWSNAQIIDVFFRLMGWTKPKGRPRGKPFSSEYQPERRRR